MKKNTTKKGLILGNSFPKLSPTEQEVLYLLTTDFLTPNKIALRRNCSTQYIYKVIRNLKKKGALKLGFTKVAKTQPTTQPNNQIRLHGQEFNIKIIWKDERYTSTLSKANQLHIDNNTVRLYKHSIEIYSGQSFLGDTAHKATSRSMEYWNKFLLRLEQELRVILIKSRSQNIKIVNAHYAQINNGLAKECEKDKHKVRIYTNDDGKLWFTIDNSFNLNEAETLHPQTSKQDMGEVVEPFFNDLRDNKPPLSSDIARYIQKTQIQIERLTQAQINTQGQFDNLIKALTPRKLNGSNGNTKPDYFG